LLQWRPSEALQLVRMRFLRLILVAILSFAVVSNALAQGVLDDAFAAYRGGDYAKAVELLRPIAEKGDASAQYRLALMYSEGKGVQRDDKAALTWFQKAAEQGDAAAQYDTGVSYATGAGTAKNDAEAAKWFRRAANQGMPYAQLNLGLLYASGHGVPQDNAEAMTWLQLALFALPPGGARFDVARAMEDVSKNMTWEQREDARERARVWKAKPEKLPPN
jgi:TPR repeat protein